MAYNPSQPRVSGKFSGPGTQPQPARPTPAALAAAKKVLAQRAVQAHAQARLTPKQRVQKREHDLALRIMAQQKRASLAKVRRAQALLRHQAAQRAHAASERAGAIAAGAAAGQRTPEGRRFPSAISPGSGRAPSQSAVQARLRQYIGNAI
jgi:hypothetical protein